MMTTPSFRSYNEFFGFALFEELRRQGLTDVFVAPGSRSTPLVLGAEQVKLKTHVHFDERSLAFAALGYAKATGRPAAIVTTSGTAVSNLLPAVTEAHHSSIPMILLTADRPFELRNVGSNQAIDQTQLFDSVVVWSKDVQPEIPSAAILSTAAEVYRQSLRGPVQLNCAFREPLSPPASGDYPLNSSVQNWLQDPRPFHQLMTIPDSPLPEVTLEGSYDRPLVLISSGLQEFEEKQILRWCRDNGLPVIADVLTLARQEDDILTGADWWIPDLAEPPDLVIWYGSVPQSKNMRSFLSKGKFQIVQMSGHHERKDDMQLRKSFFPNLARVSGLQAKPDWVTKLVDLNARARAFLHETSQELNESNCIRKFASSSNGFVMVGSSRPIRDLESFGQKWPRLYANRGTSGIDGNLATFAGLCLGSGLNGNLVLGDLAFLHDVGSLALCRSWNIQGRILIIDNNGGGIFHFLPVAEAPVPNSGATFEKYFGTPHNLNLLKIIEGFGFAVREVRSLEDLEASTPSDGGSPRGKTSLEFLIYRSDRQQNHLSHQKRRELWKSWPSTVS